MAAEAHGKCIEVFAELLPGIRKIAALGNAIDPFMRCFLNRLTSQEERQGEIAA